MNYLNKQLHFIASSKKKILAGSLLGLFLAMIIIFLEPFDTNQYEADYRLISLLGFGVLVSCVFILQSHFENRWYNNLNKVWLVKHEIWSAIFFFMISGTVLFLYNNFVINGLEYSLGRHLWYYSHIILAMIPIIAPLYMYLRQKFGERIVPLPPDELLIEGKNKKESLQIKQSTLLYIQSVENYIEIYYLDENKMIQSTTFRQTLVNINEQVSFLEKCHRSYLVNMNNVECLEGNSQSAKLVFKDTDYKIPLSKTFYKGIKNRLV